MTHGDANSRTSPPSFAVKRVARGPALTPADEAALRDEVAILGAVEHASVVRVYDFFEAADAFHLVLELVGGGELFDYLLKTGRQTEEQARKLFRQLISAVHYCHERNVW